MLCASWWSRKYQFFGCWFDLTEIQLAIYCAKGKHTNHYYTRVSLLRGRRGCDHMVVGLATSFAISAYHH